MEVKKCGGDRDEPEVFDFTEGDDRGMNHSTNTKLVLSKIITWQCASPHFVIDQSCGSLLLTTALVSRYTQPSSFIQRDDLLCSVYACQYPFLDSMFAFYPTPFLPVRTELDCPIFCSAALCITDWLYCLLVL